MLYTMNLNLNLNRYLYLDDLYIYILTILPFQIFFYITETLIPSLITSPPDVETLRIYITLPLYHNFTNICHYKTLQGAFCKAFISLKEEARHIISLWWSESPTYYFERLVRIYKAVMLEFLKDSVQNKVII